MKSMKKIGIIGMGYVGLPLWINFSKNGFQAVGFDAKKDIVASINKGQSYIGHIPSAGIKKARKAGSYGTSDMSEIQGVDAIIICVPTPISKNRERDLHVRSRRQRQMCIRDSNRGINYSCYRRTELYYWQGFLCCLFP